MGQISLLGVTTGMARRSLGTDFTCRARDSYVYMSVAESLSLQEPRCILGQSQGEDISILCESFNTTKHSETKVPW